MIDVIIITWLACFWKTRTCQFATSGIQCVYLILFNEAGITRRNENKKSTMFYERNNHMTKAIVMGTKQAAEKIGVTDSTILKHIEAGNLKAKKTSKGYTIKASDLRTFATKRRKGELEHSLIRFCINKPSTVARKYGVGLSTVYEHVKKGKLRAFNTDKGIRIYASYAKSLYGKR